MTNFFLSWLIIFLIWGLIYLFFLLIKRLFKLIFKISDDRIKNFSQTSLILLLCSIPFVIYYGPKGSIVVLLTILFIALWVYLTLFIIKIFNYFNSNHFFLKKLSSITTNIFGKFGLIIIIISWGFLMINIAGNIGKFLSNNYYFVKYLKY